MWKMGWFVVVRGHLRSLKIALIRLNVYKFLFAFHCNYIPILHRFWDTARYWSKIADCNLPHLYLAPPLEFRRDFWLQQTRVPGLSYGIVCV